MDPTVFNAWIQAAQVLIAVGVNIVGAIRGMIGSAHPELTTDQINQICEAILADDAVRAAFAARAAGVTPEPIPSPPEPVPPPTVKRKH